MTVERSFEERARVSAPVIRTFVNIARRWRLSEAEQSQLLQCSLEELREWAGAAQGYKLLVLETGTLLRASAVLGVYADLRQFLVPDEEPSWLFQPRQSPPFYGRAPITVLWGPFEDQMAVRRYLAGVVAGHAAPNAIDLNSKPYTDDDLIWTVAPPGEIRAICFDAFGTLVEIADKRRPFHALVEGEPSNAAAVRALTHPIGLKELSRELAISIGEARLTELEADLQAECASTRLRRGMDLVWAALRRAALKIAICSNLAEPYEQALLASLPGIPDAIVLSFRAGLMKPQKEIYQRVSAQLGLPPSQVLFVGDSLEADVLGPRSAGMFAIQVAEFEVSYASRASPDAPHELVELFERIAAAKAN